MDHKKRNTLGILSSLVAGAALSAFGSAAFAQETSTFHQDQILKYGNGHYLAFVESESLSTNRRTREGLGVLQAELVRRTSLDPKEEIVALDLDRDTLAPFRYIYWPITTSDGEISAEAQSKVQGYLDAGKVIMFDVLGNQTDNEAAVARVLGKVNLGPLSVMPEDYTLTKIFYLTNGLPGSYSVGSVQIQSPNPNSSEDTTSVIIARRNWAGAWSGDSFGTTSDQYDMTLRVGINAVLYAYTGDYKKDQFDMQRTLDLINE